MSPREWKSSVIVGMAVAMIVRSCALVSMLDHKNQGEQLTKATRKKDR